MDETAVMMRAFPDLNAAHAGLELASYEIARAIDARAMSERAELLREATEDLDRARADLLRARVEVERAL